MSWVKILYLYIEVNDPYFYEKLIHNKLKKIRINKKREFFRIDYKDVVKYFNIDNLVSFGGNKKRFSKKLL